jgi:hypothetical protein
LLVPQPHPTNQIGPLASWLVLGIGCVSHTPNQPTNQIGPLAFWLVQPTDLFLGCFQLASSIL